MKLQQVTYENFDDVVDLQLHEAQKDFLASNVYSIAQSKFDPHYHPRAIYLNENLIGFVMYHSQDCDILHQVGIHRFMIDARHQGQGLGRRALALVITEIKSTLQVDKITICYHPGNPNAKSFYASFGFVEVGIDEEGEMIAEINLSHSEG